LKAIPKPPFIFRGLRGPGKFLSAGPRFQKNPGFKKPAGRPPLRHSDPAGEVRTGVSHGAARGKSETEDDLPAKMGPCSTPFFRAGKDSPAGGPVEIGRKEPLNIGMMMTIYMLDERSGNEREGWI